MSILPVAVGTVVVVLFLCHLLSFCIAPVFNGGFSPNYAVTLTGNGLTFIPALRLGKLIDNWTWWANFDHHSLGIMLTHMRCAIRLRSS